MASVIGVNNEDYIVVNKNVSIKRSEFKDVTKKMQYVWVCIIKELMDDVGILVATSESDIKHEHKSFLQLCEGENGEVIDGNWLNSKLKVEKQTIKEKGVNNSENTTGFEYSSTGWIRVRMNPDKDPMRNGYMAAPYYMKGHKESLLIPTISCSGIESRTIINLFSTGSYIGGFILVPKQGPLAGRVFGLRDSSFVAGFDMRAFPKYLSSGTLEQREKLEKAARNEVKPSDKPIKKDIIEVYRRLNQKKDVQEQSKKSQQPQNIEKETPVKKKATESNLLLGGLGKLGKKAPEPVKETATVKEKAPVKEVIPEVKEKKSRSKHYNIVGRYCENGVQIVAWELQATDESRSFICAKDTLAFLVGKGLVDNCKGVGIRGYKTLEDGTREAQGAYFIGKDCNLASLPVFDNVTKKFRNTDGVGHVRRDDTATSVMNKVLLIGVVKHGRVIDGYVAKNSAGAKRFLSREEVIRRAKEGKIGNARVQQYNGRDLLRSIKGQGELESLPLMDKDGNLVEV